MIFAVGCGSEGALPEHYSLYAPFSLSPNHRLGEVDESRRFQVGEHEIRIVQLHHHYALSVAPFSKWSAAEQFLGRIRASFLWLALQKSLGIKCPPSVTPIMQYPEPQPVLDPTFKEVVATRGWEAVDGHYDAGNATVVPEATRLMRWESGKANIIRSPSVPSVVDCISEALAFPSIDRVSKDEKLSLAIDLYSQYHFELSDNARFIALVTVLEALTPSTTISDVAKTALAEARETVKRYRSNHDKSSSSYADLNRLLSRLSRLEEEAIGTTIRTYVSDLARVHTDLGAPDELSAGLREAYERRSRLLHEGAANESDVRDSRGFLENLVPKLLKFLFVRHASGNE